MTQDPGRMKRRLLVVDDDDLVIASLRLALPSNWTLQAVNTPKEVPSQGFSAALVDMHLTGDLSRAEGLEVVRDLRAKHPHLEIIATSGDLDRNLMEQGLKSGASRFLAKPVGREELELTLDKIEALLLLREITIGDGSQSRSPVRWVGSSPASHAATKALAALKGEHGPILIEGESGTGKEVAAQLLHHQEKENGAARPFVSINLGAIPDAVFESEFFGHVKGAFTGADQNKMGLAEAAHGGDLFLDEVEALPMASQAKLLRFLESGEVRRVGARESVKVDVRIIAATNRSLQEMVQNKEFREDLLWRLQGKRVHLPPLRERVDDIGELATFFLERERPRRNKSLTPDAIDALKTHSWSGNVRELKRMCEQISLHAPLPLIRGEDVRACLPGGHTLMVDGENSDAQGAKAIDLSLGLSELVARFESQVIKKALVVTPDVDRASELLGISRSSMYKKMKDYDIDR